MFVFNISIRVDSREKQRTHFSNHKEAGTCPAELWSFIPTEDFPMSTSPEATQEPEQPELPPPEQWTVTIEVSTILEDMRSSDPAKACSAWGFAASVADKPEVEQLALQVLRHQHPARGGNREIVGAVLNCLANKKNPLSKHAVTLIGGCVTGPHDNVRQGAVVLLGKQHRQVQDGQAADEVQVEDVAQIAFESILSAFCDGSPEVVVAAIGAAVLHRQEPLTLALSLRRVHDRCLSEFGDRANWVRARAISAMGELLNGNMESVELVSVVRSAATYGMTCPDEQVRSVCSSIVAQTRPKTTD